MLPHGHRVSPGFSSDILGPTQHWLPAAVPAAHFPFKPVRRVSGRGDCYISCKPLSWPIPEPNMHT